MIRPQDEGRAFFNLLMDVWDLAADTPLEREIETEDFGLISNCAQALQMAIV